jgi:hypothetical protein
LFAIRVEISRGPLVRTKKNQVPFAAKLAHILCFLCPSIAVVVVVGRGWCFDFVAIVIVGLFCGLSVCTHTFLHSRDFTSLVSLVCSFFQD